MQNIDWTGCENNPILLTMADYDKVIVSLYFMARKFDVTMDRDIVRTLIKRIRRESEY